MHEGLPFLSHRELFSYCKIMQENDLEMNCLRYRHKKSGGLKNQPQLPFTYVYSYAPTFKKLM